MNTIQYIFRADSWFAPSQWETSLQSNTVCHWLGANLESAPDFVLFMIAMNIYLWHKFWRHFHKDISEFSISGTWYCHINRIIMVQILSWPGFIVLFLFLARFSALFNFNLQIANPISGYLVLQESSWVWVQPMRGGVTM